jgi:hypothetical protein
MNLRYIIRDGEKVLQQSHIEYSLSGNLSEMVFDKMPTLVWSDVGEIPCVDEITNDKKL